MEEMVGKIGDKMAIKDKKGWQERVGLKSIKKGE